MAMPDVVRAPLSQSMEHSPALTRRRIDAPNTPATLNRHPPPSDRLVHHERRADDEPSSERDEIDYADEEDDEEVEVRARGLGQAGEQLASSPKPSGLHWALGELGAGDWSK